MSETLQTLVDEIVSELNDVAAMPLDEERERNRWSDRLSRFALVPKEPTVNMIWAAQDAIERAYKASDWDDAKEMAESLDPRRIWDVMIAAAPAESAAPSAQTAKPTPPPMTISHGGRAMGGREHPADETCPACDNSKSAPTPSPDIAALRERAGKAIATKRDNAAFHRPRGYWLIADRLEEDISLLRDLAAALPSTGTGENGLGVAAKWHERQAEFFDRAEDYGEAAWHRKSSKAIRALSSPTPEGER